MAEGPKKQKRLSVEAKKRKRERNREMAKTRVELGIEFVRWRLLKDKEGCKSDTNLATLLLDCYVKTTEASLSGNTGPARTSPSVGPRHDHDERCQLTTPCPVSGPLLAKCPSCGFPLPQWSLQNGNRVKEESDSIEVTLELEQKDDPVSGSEDADRESDVPEEEEEENEGSEVEDPSLVHPRSGEGSSNPDPLKSSNPDREGPGLDEESEEEEKKSDKDWTPDVLCSPDPSRSGLDEESEEEEKNSDKDWNPDLLYSHDPSRSSNPDLEGSELDDEESEEEEKNVDMDWTPGLLYSPTRTAAAQKPNGDTVGIPGKRKLCPECGAFYKKLPHECEHKTKPFVCYMCGKRYISAAALKTHYGVHSKSCEHSCKFCHASFKTRAEKLDHERIHQDQSDLYKCPDDALPFITLEGREEDMKVHKKHFKCALCGIEFKNKSYYLRHIVVHTGEKPFKCSVCDQRFNQEGHLKSHMRLHTGERPYSCKLCEKSFNHNVSLKSHMQRYHPTEQESPGNKEAEKGGNEAKVKKKTRPPTGRPKGRPKSNAAERQKYSKTTEESNDENE